MSKSKALQFSCDSCGCAKQVNDCERWRVLILTELGGVPGAALYQWSDSLATMKDAAHCCGDRCTLVLLERHLALEKARAVTTT